MLEILVKQTRTLQWEVGINTIIKYLVTNPYIYDFTLTDVSLGSTVKETLTRLKNQKILKLKR